MRIDNENTSISFNSLLLFLFLIRYQHELEPTDVCYLIHLFLFLRIHSQLLFSLVYRFSFFICYSYDYSNMSNLAKLDFVALDISGKNYLS